MAEAGGGSSSYAVGREKDGRVLDIDWLISTVDESEKTPQAGSNALMQKVPAWMRKSPPENEYFNPRMVALGPFHHGQSNLKRFQEIKVIAFRTYVDFVQRRNGFSKRRAAQCLCFEVVKAIDKATSWYREEVTRKFSTEVLECMMVLDGCFILNFIECANENKFDLISEVEVPLVVLDMFLLENQIPFTVFRALSRMIDGHEFADREKILHFIHSRILLSSFYSLTGHTWLSFDELRQLLINEWSYAAHLLDILCVFSLGEPQRVASYTRGKKRRDDHPLFPLGSVRELKDAGIRFTSSRSMHLTDIRFQKNLFFPEILLPPIVITKTTIRYILNMVAFEQHLSTPSERRITSYTCFLNSVIKNAADVKELRLRGVLYHALGSDAEVAELWNRWPIETTVNLPVHIDVIRYVFDLRSKWWKISIARFWYAHFGNAWQAFSWYAAVTLLFAALQAIFAIIHRG